MIIKDLQEIASISRRNEKQNWKFRSLLKTLDGNRIDRIVKPIYESVITQINCQDCGNCCRLLQPLLTDSDMATIGQKLNLTPDDIREKYSELDEFNETILTGSPCVFLSGNHCQIYEARPEACRSYPHLHKKGFTSRLFGIMENISICPIAFNVYEQLKYQLKNNQPFS